MENPYVEFNLHLKHLIRCLKTSYPEIKELYIMYGLYKIMKTVNKKMPQKYFHKLVADKYSNDIINKNFDIFMSDEFDDPDVTYILIPLKLKFNLLSNDEKNIIWEHLIVLLSLNKRCIESKNLII